MEFFDPIVYYLPPFSIPDKHFLNSVSSNPDDLFIHPTINNSSSTPLLQSSIQFPAPKPFDLHNQSIHNIPSSTPPLQNNHFLRSETCSSSGDGLNNGSEGFNKGFEGLNNGSDGLNNVSQQKSTNEKGHPRLSFADTVRARTSAGAHCLPKPSMKGNFPSIHIGKSLHQRGLDFCKFALVGRMDLNQVKPDRIRQAAPGLWKLNGPCKITPLGRGFFMIRLDNEVDFSKVLTTSVWYIDGTLLKIQRWTPDFDPAAICQSTANVWIRFPGLRQQFWDSDILMSMANAIGVPISVDPNTRDRNFGFYASILVKVDMAKPLASKIIVDIEESGEFYQNVEYYKLPKYCSVCRMVGHSPEECRRIKKIAETKEMVGNGNTMLVLGGVETSSLSHGASDDITTHMNDGTAEPGDAAVSIADRSATLSAGFAVGSLSGRVAAAGITDHCDDPGILMVSAINSANAGASQPGFVPADKPLAASQASHGSLEDPDANGNLLGGFISTVAVPPTALSPVSATFTKPPVGSAPVAGAGFRARSPPRVGNGPARPPFSFNWEPLRMDTVLSRFDADVSQAGDGFSKSSSSGGVTGFSKPTSTGGVTAPPSGKASSDGFSDGKVTVFADGSGEQNQVYKTDVLVGGGGAVPSSTGGAGAASAGPLPSSTLSDSQEQYPSRAVQLFGVGGGKSSSSSGVSGCVYAAAAVEAVRAEVRESNLSTVQWTAASNVDAVAATLKHKEPTSAAPNPVSVGADVNSYTGKVDEGGANTKRVADESCLEVNAHARNIVLNVGVGSCNHMGGDFLNNTNHAEYALVASNKVAQCDIGIVNSTNEVPYVGTSTNINKMVPSDGDIVYPNNMVGVLVDTADCINDKRCGPSDHENQSTKLRNAGGGRSWKVNPKLFRDKKKKSSSFRLDKELREISLSNRWEDMAKLEESDADYSDFSDDFPVAPVETITKPNGSNVITRQQARQHHL